MLPFVYFNGQVQPYESAGVRLSDLALLRGYGIFDFFAFREGHPLFLTDYLDRFYRSAGLLRLEVPMSPEALASVVYELIKANAQPQGGIRLLLTGGYSPNGYTPTVPNLAIIQYPLSTAPSEVARRGAYAMTYRHQRELPQIKSTNYLTGIFIQPRLQQARADCVLYHDNDTLRESDRSNCFIVTADGVVATPRERVLLGITRKQVLLVAQRMGLVTEERDISLRELATAPEVFLTGSTKGVLPVTRIDNRTVGNGQMGEVTARLQVAFQEHVAAYLMSKGAVLK